MREKDILLTAEHPVAAVKHIVRGIARRGLQPIPPKTSISLRVDADVLEWFKAQGAGYQTRMNAVLRAFKEPRPNKPAEAATAPVAVLKNWLAKFGATPIGEMDISPDADVIHYSHTVGSWAYLRGCRAIPLGEKKKSITQAGALARLDIVVASVIYRNPSSERRMQE